MFFIQIKTFFFKHYLIILNVSLNLNEVLLLSNENQIFQTIFQIRKIISHIRFSVMVTW